jgi:hypothetical protein
LLDPVAEKDVGWLCAAVRTKADDPFKRCPVQEVRSGLAFDVNAANGELLDELSPGQRPLIRKCVTDDPDAPRAGVLIQSQFHAPPLIGCNKDGTEERQEPDEILCRQKVQRTSLSPRADDRTLLYSCSLDVISDQPDAPSTQSKRCSTRILCLDTA